MSTSMPRNAPVSPAAPTPLLQQPPMIFLLGLVGVTLLTACIAVIVLTIKLGNGNTTTVVTRAEVRGAPPAQPSVVTQVPASPKPEPKPKPAPSSAATVIPKQEPKPPATVIPEPQPKPPAATAVSAATTENPWKLTTPNALGIPIQGHTAVIVDAVEQSEPFLDPVMAALVSGLSHDQGDTTASYFYINENKIKPFDDNPIPPGPNSADQLAGYQSSIQAAGRRGFWNGYDAGVKSGAGRVILITGRKSWDQSISFLKQKMQAGQEPPQITFVHIDAEVPGLRDALAEFGNAYVTIPLDQLQTWQSTAE